MIRYVCEFIAFLVDLVVGLAGAAAMATGCAFVMVGGIAHMVADYGRSLRGLPDRWSSSGRGTVADPVRTE